MKVFKYSASVRGNLQSSFVFETKDDLDRWLKVDFPALCEKYGELTVRCGTLPGLKLGDRCKVYGEGADVFVIEGQKIYSKDRYGFLLDSGWCEEVYKCYAVEE